MMRRSWAVAAGVAVAVVAGSQVRGTSAEQAQPAADPTFKVDATWPQEFPNHWVMGSVTGVFVDAKDHVWITHLPETLTEEELYEEQTPPMAHLLQGGARRHRARPERQGRAGLGRQGQGRAGQLAAQPARHLRRPHRPRVGRHAHAPPRDEVHARGQAGADRRRSTTRTTAATTRRCSAARRASGSIRRPTRRSSPTATATAG